MCVSGKPCKDSQINGVSLLPLLNGVQQQQDRSIYLYRSYEDQNSAIIEGDWKLIKYRSGKLEMYNIINDEGEQHDLSTTDSTRCKAMLNRLLEWEKDATPKYLL